MTLQRCQNCRRLTVASLCSMCHAGAAGEQVDREYLAVLAVEEARFELDELAARAGGRMPDWTARGAQNMTPEERAAMWGSAIRADECPWIASEDELVERVEKRRDTMRRLFPSRPSLPARLRRWLRGAP